MSIYAINQDMSQEAELAIKLHETIAGGNQPLLQNKNIPDLMMEFESANKSDKQQVVDAEDAAFSALEDINLRGFLSDRLEGSPADDKIKQRCIDAGMDAAAVTLMAGGNPQAYQMAFMSAADAAGNGTDVTLINDYIGANLELEGFDKHDYQDYVEVAAIVNAIAASTNPMSESFFRTVVLPANRPGIQMSVQIPNVYRRKARDNSGKANDLVRQPIIHSLVDHTILADNSTQVVPFANPGNADIDKYLVAETDVPTKLVEVGGAKVQTRPIKYGAKVDLIGISGYDELLKGKEQDETDTLAPIVSLGVQVAKLTKDSNSFSVEMDIEGKPGALFTSVKEGEVIDQSVVFNGRAVITGKTMLTNGSTVEEALGLGTVLSLPAKTPYFIEIGMRLSGSLEMENGNILVDAAAFEIVGVHSGENAETEIPLTAGAGKDLVDALAVAGLGYYPAANRTNSNLRDLATICDMGKTYNYCIPIRPAAPLVSISPVIGEGNGASLEAMNMNKRVRDANNAVTELINFEAVLSNGHNLPSAASAAIGSRLVTPTYAHHKINLADRVQTRRSGQALNDLRTLLTDAVTMMANQLLIKSNYLAALEVYTGSTSNFEVIVGTDPHIASHLMTSGDGRTLGNGRNFSVSSHLDARMRGRIYISVSRTDVKGADPLSFGVFGTVAPLIYSATTQRSGVQRELHLHPRDAFAVTCPILGRIDVDGLETFFSDAVKS